MCPPERFFLDDASSLRGVSYRGTSSKGTHNRDRLRLHLQNHFRTGPVKWKWFLDRLSQNGNNLASVYIDNAESECSYIFHVECIVKKGIDSLLTQSKGKSFPRFFQFKEKSFPRWLCIRKQNIAKGYGSLNCRINVWCLLRHISSNFQLG